MLDIKVTGTLYKLHQELHTLNTRYKSLEIEEQVFVVDKEDIHSKKMNLESKMNSVIKQIGIAVGNL